MAAKQAGNGSVTDLTVEILKGIRKELRTLNVRFDHLIQFAGERYHDHEERLRKIEQRLARR